MFKSKFDLESEKKWGGGEEEGGDEAVFYIKFIELFGEHYQSKIAAVSQSTVETTNFCTGETANSSIPVCR